MYGSWSVPKLKQELSRRNAAISGRKQDLVERLQAYDRYNNFSGKVVLIPDPVIVDWPTNGFKSISAEHQLLLPKISMGQIEGYIMYRSVLEKSVGDLKSIEKGRNLYVSGRVEACSVHITFKDINFTGIVRAAMKSLISYNYKLRIDGRNGEMLNSDCECPAGKGPHSTCKHIAAVLLMLHDFTNNGNLKVAKSATEILQTFHKPRKNHTGSPIKSEDLPVTAKPPMDDPRPPKYRKLEGYNDYVRGLVINYCATTSKDITMRYMYTKADLQTAVVDHDYTKLPFTEYWIDRSFQVTTRYAREIEETTRAQASSKLWHQERRWRITASKFGDICRATCRRNMEKLCKSIINTTPLCTPPIVHGRQYEQKAITKFEEITGLKVKRCGLFVDVTRPYLGATPDGLIQNSSEAIIEVKCPYVGRNDEKIEPGSHFPFLYNDNGCIRLKQSHPYFMQIQGQLYIAEKNVCYFVVFIFKDIFIEKIHVDTDYCRYSLLPKLDLFYLNHFRKFLAKLL